MNNKATAGHLRLEYEFSGMVNGSEVTGGGTGTALLSKG